MKKEVTAKVHLLPSPSVSSKIAKTKCSTEKKRVLFLSDTELMENKGVEPHHIYITIDSEITPGDSFINDDNNVLYWPSCANHNCQTNRRRIIASTNPIIESVVSIPEDFIKDYIKSKGSIKEIPCVMESRELIRFNTKLHSAKSLWYEPHNAPIKGFCIPLRTDIISVSEADGKIQVNGERVYTREEVIDIITDREMETSDDWIMRNLCRSSTKRWFNKKESLCKD